MLEQLATIPLHEWLIPLRILLTIAAGLWLIRVVQRIYESRVPPHRRKLDATYASFRRLLSEVRYGLTQRTK